MIHLGTRVSALLDGRLSSAEEERAWTHVHTCDCCRAAVEREGWVKRELAGLAEPPAGAVEAASDRLKGTLSRGCAAPDQFAEGWGARDRLDDLLASGATPYERRGGAHGGAGVAGMSIGVSVGVAMVGLLALSAPAQAPAPARPLEPARAGLSGTTGVARPATGTSGVGRARETASTVAHVSARYRAATEWMRNPL